MLIVGLGKITVTTGGTPVPVSSTKILAHAVYVSFDPADTTATVFLLDSNGNKILALATGQGPLMITADDNGNPIDLSKLQADAIGNGKGPIVGYTVN